MKLRCWRKSRLMETCLLVVVINVVILYIVIISIQRVGDDDGDDDDDDLAGVEVEIRKVDPSGGPLLNFVRIATSYPLDSPEQIRRYREERFRLFQGRTPPSGLGEGGNSSYLYDVEPRVVMETVEREKFNKLLSDRISLDRSLPDYRIEECKSLAYPESLPRASVVIVFCNEAPSVVLRTVHSVVNRSPPRHLREIILVDDASDRGDVRSVIPGHLREAFPDGIARLIRSEERLGLIRARMRGAREATGEVLVFLDAHCEVTFMWLEPLLSRIKEDSRVVVCPLIDLLCTQTLGFSRNGGGSAGGFGWNLVFDWINIQESVNAKRKNETYPIRSPAMAGGLFAMDREFFFHLGGYDEGMEIWGGENIEISLRIWMCGGSLEFIPCSRVGHLYRAAFPYSIKGINLDLNPKRVAEVWLDDYKRIFYMHRPDLKSVDAGDLSSRRELRSRLKCHEFKWYLDNVYSELFVPDEGVKAHGTICNPSSGMCWDSMGRDSSYSSYTVGLYHDQNGNSLNQFFSLDNENKIRKNDRCMKTRRDKNEVRLEMEKCTVDKGIRVEYVKKSGLMILETGECVQMVYDEGWKREALVASVCTSDADQMWQFQHVVE